jgi:hypothetical protein
LNLEALRIRCFSLTRGRQRRGERRELGEETKRNSNSILASMLSRGGLLNKSVIRMVINIRSASVLYPGFGTANFRSES